MMDFTVSVNHKVSIKENEKRDKYLDHSWELGNLQSIMVTVVPIVYGTFGSVH